MENHTLRNLIKYIVFEIKDNGGVVLRTRLVKMLYLCDIEYYRSHRKQMTPLVWKRYKYGPFSFDLQSITNSIGFNMSEESVDFVTLKGFKYDVLEPIDIDKILNPSERSIVDRVIKRWGQAELEDILDYVYCETEPMYNAQMGEQLDFSKITRGIRRSSSTTIDIGEDNLQTIKNIISDRSNISRVPISISVTQMERKVKYDEAISLDLEGKINKTESDKIQMFEGIE